MNPPGMFLNILYAWPNPVDGHDLRITGVSRWPKSQMPRIWVNVNRQAPRQIRQHETHMLLVVRWIVKYIQNEVLHINPVLACGLGGRRVLV